LPLSTDWRSAPSSTSASTLRQLRLPLFPYTTLFRSKGEVIQFVVCCNMEGTARFGFVHLTVAQECPDVLVCSVFDSAVVNVPVELGLMNCIHRAQAHGYGRELPEIIQHLRVRV